MLLAYLYNSSKTVLLFGFIFGSRYAAIKSIDGIYDNIRNSDKLEVC